MRLHIFRRMTTSFCTQCGASLIAGAPFCSNCGASTGNAPTQPVPATVPSGGYGAAAAPARAYTPAAGIPKPAGFWIRFVAAIIDGIIVQLLVVPVAFIVGLVIGVAGAASQSNTDALQAVSGMLGFFIGLVGGWIYEAWMTSSSKQATVGKLALGLKVIGEDGGRISFARATGRFFGKYVSVLTLLIGYIMAAFTDRKRALHDMLAGTYVVYKN